MVNRKKTREEVIAKFKKRHGDKYNYDKFVYLGALTKSIVTCPIHGDFTIIPNQHINGCGCPQCAKERQRSIMRTFVHGVGYYDYENIGEITLLKEKARSYWRVMLQRCYDEKFKAKQITYKDCYVCDEWLTFSNFLKWFFKNYKEGYELDKDLLSGKENKRYSPETCCFLPHELNGLLCRCNASRGKYPIGVHKNRKKYAAALRKKNETVRLGSYNTPEEAFMIYKQAKEAYIKEIAKKHYDAGNISKRVYDAFLKYKVEITD